MENFNRYIDYTILKADTKESDILKLCQEAKENDFKSVCINPCFVEYAYGILKDSETEVCTVIGFPLGANTSAVKAFEAKTAIELGATEVDMVINIGKLKDKDFEYVKNDIKAVVKSVEGKGITKVIIECCLLTDEEKIKACELAVEAGAEFVKTSTGFSTHGATVSDVALMKKTVGEKALVKAAGGIRDKKTALEMIEAGADRIGTSRVLS